MNGYYTGTVLVRVKRQPAPVEIPLRLQVKHGALAALLVLALGLAVGAVFGWWSREGQPLRDLAKEIEGFSAELKEAGLLQAAERDAVMQLIDKAVHAINTNQAAGEARKFSEEAKKLAETGKAEAQKFLASVTELGVRVSQLRPAATFARAWPSISKTCKAASAGANLPR